MAHDVNQRETEVAAQVRSALIERISSERYDLWISADTDWTFDGKTLTLSFASEFTRQLARKTLGEDIAAVLSEVVGPEIAIDYKHDASLASRQVARAPDAIVRSSSNGTCSVGRSRAPVASADGPAEDRNGAANLPFPIDSLVSRDRNAAVRVVSLQPSTDLWKSIVRGTANELACTTAALAVSEPGRLSPAYFFGPSGCGKSLIAAAITQRLRVERRMRRVVHMTSEQFTNDFVEGLRGGGLPMFRRKYRDVEAFILDDIQFFVGKKSTLAEVRHTLDNLIGQGKQVVCTGDRSLNELQSLGPEIIGRLRGGLVAPISPLDRTMRAQLLANHLTAQGVDLDRAVVDQLAERCSGDGRVVSGVAKRLAATTAQFGNKLTWEQAWQSVFDLVQATQPIVRIADIERIVCRVFGLESNSLQSSTKIRSVSQPRMLAMFLARKYTPAAYKEIGEYFGKRRHSTVISAEKTVESWLNESSDVPCGRGLTLRDAIRHVESQLQVG